MAHDDAGHVRRSMEEHEPMAPHQGPPSLFHPLALPSCKDVFLFLAAVIIVSWH
jgi:hypothetical protein